MRTINKLFLTHWRHYLLILLALGSLLLMLLQTPIPQDMAYHHFADTRAIFQIHNYCNVMSNLPFLFVGIAGVFSCFKQALGESGLAWFVFFAGLALVGIGSAYYHLNPGNQSLVWDRLPMTMAFMALFTALLGELVHPKLAKYGLPPLLLMGLCSVVVWYCFDDLRFYVWVQFMPLLVIPAMLFLYPKRYSHSNLILIALLLYVLAKVLEAFDAQIFTLFQNEMAGHAIKHVIAAMAGGVILWMLKVRKLLAVDLSH